MRNEEREFSLIRMGRRVVPSGRLWNPAADVFQCEDGWVVKLDLAGICSDELEIQIHDSKLRISGCRRDTLYREGFVYQQMEITYSRFEKTSIRSNMRELMPSRNGAALGMCSARF